MIRKRPFNFAQERTRTTNVHPLSIIYPFASRVRIIVYRGRGDLISHPFFSLFNINFFNSGLNLLHIKVAKEIHGRSSKALIAS